MDSGGGCSEMSSQTLLQWTGAEHADGLQKEVDRKGKGGSGGSVRWKGEGEEIE